jgi:hypothetical protein
VNEAGWVQLAETRISNVLSVRRYASQRQLEKKISEQGPSNKRPQPPHVSTALKNLQKQSRVASEAVGHNLPLFFMPYDFGSPADVERRTYVLELYRRFQRFTLAPELCGNALERLVDEAANLGGMHSVLGPIHPNQKVNGIVVEREIDHLLIPKGYVGPSLVVEDKNMREWLNPSSEQVWSVIGNASKFPNALPVLVCRKMNFIAFRMFKRIGMACWQVFSQYFDPSIEEQLLEIRHKDGLGFSDVTTETKPPAALVRFFSSVIPKYSPDFMARFERHRALLRHYAVDERLDGSKNAEGKELHPAARTATYYDFLEELRKRRGPPEWHEEYEEDLDYPEDEPEN